MLFATLANEVSLRAPLASVEDFPKLACYNAKQLGTDKDMSNVACLNARQVGTLTNFSKSACQKGKQPGTVRHVSNLAFCDATQADTVKDLSSVAGMNVRQGGAVKISFARKANKTTDRRFSNVVCCDAKTRWPCNILVRTSLLQCHTRWHRQAHLDLSNTCQT